MSNYPTNLSENSGKLSKHCGITKKEAKKVLSLGFNISKYNTNNIIHSIIRGCQNSHRLKITFATTICGKGDFVKRDVLVHYLIAK